MFNNGNGGQSNPSLTNVIAWGNTAGTGNQLYNREITPVLSYTLIQSGTNDIVNDPIEGGSVDYRDGILTDDPLFADAAGGNLQLLPGSPAIDSGTDEGAPAFDILGLPRPANGGVDMGAYEMQGYTLAISGGNNQTTPPGSPFPLPLQITLSSAAGEPVGPGGIIRFTAPAAGASLTQTLYTATTTAAGLATVTVAANSITGTYPVTAATTGAPDSVTFSLANTVSTGGNVYLPLILKQD